MPGEGNKEPIISLATNSVGTSLLLRDCWMLISTKYDVVRPGSPIRSKLLFEVLVVDDVPHSLQISDGVAYLCHLFHRVDTIWLVETHPLHLDEMNVHSFEEPTGGLAVENVDLAAFDVDL